VNIFPQQDLTPQHSMTLWAWWKVMAVYHRVYDYRYVRCRL